MPLYWLIIHAFVWGTHTESTIILFNNLELTGVHFDCINSLSMLVSLEAYVRCKIWQMLELCLFNIVLESYIFCKFVNFPIISINHFGVVQDLIWLRLNLLCLLSFELILLLLLLKPLLHLHVLNIPKKSFLPPFNLDPLKINLW